MTPVRVLFVCMGNICRSPMAEGVFRAMVARAGLDHLIEIDSAGTSGWHEGDGADERAVAAASARGYDLSMCVSRPVEWQDYKTFDYILAMDHLNLKTLLQESSSEPGDRIHLFMAFAEDGEARAVPDPYGGGDEGFEVVMDMVEAGCTALLSHIEHQHLGQATSA